MPYGDKEKQKAYLKEYEKTRKARDRSEYQKSYQKQYRPKHRETSSDACRKRRTLRLGNKHEAYKSEYIFERDGWICGICGQKINKRLKYPHPRSKSIDHIIALKHGGADASINVQAAHLRCNLSKNAGGGGQLRLVG